MWCGASNFAPGDVVPLATRRHGDARRSHDRVARHPRHPVGRHALLGARARARQRPQRHPRAAFRRAPRACPMATSPASSTTSCSTSTSPVTAQTPSATSVSPAISPPSWICRSRRRGRALAAARRPGGRHGRDRRRRALRPVHADGPVRASSSPRAPRGWPPGCAAVGQRPINNVVDVSNYVMLELNQPNHAYDLATLGGGGIRVRSATDGEQLTTLDGMTRSADVGRAADLRRPRRTDRPGRDHGW